jgi:3-deoxy-D-manno-octulosonic-acid transferase
MISAKRRSSILLAKYLTRILGYKIPKISFLTVSEEDCSPLQKAFPQSVVRKTGEPRWDRVFGRSKQMSLRAKVLSTSWETQTERPRGILAQVWREDLEIWRELLQELKGSPLWIVPHRVDGPHLEKIIDWLRAEGFSFVQSSTAISDSPTCRLGPSEWVVVDEMGVLAELYRSGDWAYVGGGFGQGVHSTIEPALSGLLVSAGPKKAEKFTEIGELGQQGQLEIVSDRLQLKDWLIKAKSINSETREKFRTLNARHLGATEEILKYLRSVAG